MSDHFLRRGRPGLGPTDEMMLWNIHATRSVRTIQAILRTERPATSADLDRLAAQLDTSHLSRSIRHHRPATLRRPTWTPAQPGRGDNHGVTGSPSGWRAWLDEQAYTPLTAASWRIAATQIGDTSLISVVVPHLYSDGGGLVAALAGTPAVTNRIPEHHQPAARLAANDLHIPSAAGDDSEAPIRFDTAYTSIDMQRWRDTARHAGVNPNDALVYACARAFTEQRPTHDARVGVPVDTRRQHRVSGEANQLTVVPLTVNTTQPVTAIAETLHTLLADPEHLSPITVPNIVYRCLPEPLRRRAKRPGTKSCELLVSNFGQVLGPGGIATVGDCPVSAASFRTVNTPGLHRTRQRTRASIAAAGSHHLLTLTVSVDPEILDAIEMATSITRALDPTPATPCQPHCTASKR